jgi:anaerobic magnesium-protoporphyrin IX monomethyl ester cyclase
MVMVASVARTRVVTGSASILPTEDERLREDRPMRVLLVGPDHEDNLSIRYLSAALHARGHVAELARFNTAEDHDAVVAQAETYDVVGLSMCFQSRALEFLALADGLKKAGCPMIVMGGHYATCEADELVTRHRSIDVIAVHEGEHSLVELVDAGPDRAAWAKIPGIVYFERGFVRRTGERRAIEDLDTLPVADRRGDIHLFAGVPTAYMLGSRGCVARCDYCCIVTLHKMAPGKKYRRRDPALVVEEMAALYHERGIRQFIFHDDNFLVPSLRHNHERLDAYERALDRHGMTDIGFTIKCRPPDAERSIFERLKGLGLLRVFFGIESASEAGLESIGRVQTVEQSKAALDMCRELDVSSQYTMMMFHPDATPETVDADLSFLRDNIDHALNFCRTEIYSGTPLEQRMLTEGRARGNYLARTYDIADTSIARACTAALELFGARCWEMGGLMERLIGMDHLGGVVRRFYEASPAAAQLASRWRRDFAALRRKANTDLVVLLGEVIDAARRAPSLDDSWFRSDLDRLRERERASRLGLLSDCEALRLRLDDVVLPSIGARRDPHLRLVSGPPRRRLARHAAAVALAFSVAAGAACGDDAPSAGSAAPSSSARVASSANTALSASVAPPASAAPSASGAASVAPSASAAPSASVAASVAPSASAPPPTPTKPRPPVGSGGPPGVRDHHGISEFAAPPLRLSDPDE